MTEMRAGFVDVWKALIPDKLWSLDSLGRLCGCLSFILAIDLVRLVLICYMF